MKNITIVSLCLLFGGFWKLAFADAKVAVGDSELAFPETSTLILSKSTAATDFAQGLLTNNKRHLAIWVNSQQGKVSKPFVPTKYRYAAAYTLKSLEPLTASREDFKVAKQAVAADMDDVRKIDRAPFPPELAELRRKMIASGTYPKGGVFFPDSTKVELLKDDERHYSHLVLHGVQVNNPAGPNLKRWLVYCSNLLWVKGKVIVINVSSELQEPDDYIWINRACSDLTDKVLQRNQ
jgi:hypothetical protein